MSSENQTDSEDENYKKDLEKILQKKEIWIKVDDLDMWPGCPPGENFAAEVMKVVVYGRRLRLGVWTDIRKNFIVKRIPGPSSPTHEYCDCSGMFQNEVVAYEDILPMCQSYLDKKSENDSNELPFPRFYGRSQHFLLLQDLQTEGYQLVNRIKGFSMRECTVVVQELSKFHALSFALKKDDKGLLSKNVQKLKETVFREELVGQANGAFWEKGVRFALRSLEESGDTRLKQAAEMLRLCCGSVLSTLISIVKSGYDKFEVINHGDLWSNNILIRYCESGYPIGVKFIDLQAMRYSSCVLDVMHVLFTSSRPVIYERYFDLLTEYYSSLVKNLKNLETPIPFTFNEFMTEFKQKISFGVFVACLMFTCITRTSVPTNFMTEQEMYSSLNAGYHKRLRALFLALTDSRVISTD